MVEEKSLGSSKTEMPAGFGMVYRDWKMGHITAKCAMRQLGLKGNSFFRLVRKFEKG